MYLQKKHIFVLTYYNVYNMLCGLHNIFKTAASFTYYAVYCFCSLSFKLWGTYSAPSFMEESVDTALVQYLTFHINTL